VTSDEPRLRTEDERLFGAWMRAALVHSRSRQHASRVERARVELERALASAGDWACMVSGGKDSTALGHLVAQAGPVEWVSEKDDMDYPGEVAYVTSLAERCAAPLTIVSPPFSVWDRFAAMAGRLGPLDDIHGQASEFSRDAFYAVVDGYTGPRPILLGLRAEESRGRTMNRSSRGLTYTRRSGKTICQPLADWRALDVYGYLAKHDLPLLPVYKCVALMHREDPSRIRKSWWVGGAANSTGHVRWLAHYWPSLYAKLMQVMPHARTCT
jgi:phosphoadenosine phosphosulfate reductase